MAAGKLELEHFNAEVAATLATLVDREHRGRTVEAIVAFEVLYDYLDGLTEGPLERPLESGERLYRALTEVFPGQAPCRPCAYPLAGDDGGYLWELSRTVREAVATLPGSPVIATAASRAAERCAASQVRVHAAPQVGVGQLEQWARQGAAETAALGWREYLAGSVASVLAVHALIAAAASGQLSEGEADEIEAAYLSIAALSTMLDSLVDYERDAACGDPWLVRLYGGPEPLGDRLAEVAERAVAQTRVLRHSAHHLMTLLGVVAYYTSAPEAQRGPARPIVARLHRELRPVILPTLAVMRAWRLAKSMRRRVCRGPRTRSAR